MSADRPLILIVEDDLPLSNSLATSLNFEGYRTVEAPTARQGMIEARSQPPDVVLLDLGLPDMDGLEFAKRLRQWSKMPIIVISARGQLKDKVGALDTGADDYLTKPFEVDELLARLRVALRHSSISAPFGRDTLITIGELRIDMEARLVHVGEREVHLTPTEYRVLLTLARRAGRAVTHASILETVWGPHRVHDTHNLRVFMAALRNKIEADPARPHHPSS